MPDVLSSVGGFFEKAAPAIGGATAGAGIFGNILNSITRGKEIGNLQSAEKKFANLTPEQLSGLVTRAEQPLGQDLLQSVGNTVQADLGTRGLSEAPGVFAAGEAQALAPYKLQEQQMALQLVMKQMGLPIEYAQAILQASGGGTDISRILMMLMNANKNGGSGGGGGGGSDIGGIVGLDNIFSGNGSGGSAPFDPANAGSSGIGA
jgi:hypothetical protein